MNNQLPLVSVICLSYNHAKFVSSAIQSVLDQDYANIELIVVDDASTDGSQAIIESIIKENPTIHYVSLESNHGNCKAFNLGWKKASGKYIIDLSADDIIHGNRVAIGVNELSEHGESYGVHFSDAVIIDEEGMKIGHHNTLVYYDPVPEGYVFTQLLSKYFINPVSMMITNALLEELDGYDESLSYEDFDLWVRSSKKYKYCYSHENLVSKRKMKGSHGSNQYRFGSPHLRSTFRVCQKALKLCETQAEFDALRIRINYEMKRALFSLNLKVYLEFTRLKNLMAKVRAGF